MQTEFFLIPLDELKPHVDPLAGTLWQCDPIQKKAVLDAVQNGEFDTRYWDDEKDDLVGRIGHSFHARRIANFVANGPPVDEYSIQLFLGEASAVGVGVTVNNGNHRIAAAILRGDKTVRALLYFSQIEVPYQYFPGAFPTALRAHV
ncbi:MAG: hypothetical protein ABJ360_10260 [Roseobacter sp.]